MIGRRSSSRRRREGIFRREELRALGPSLWFASARHSQRKRSRVRPLKCRLQPTSASLIGPPCQAGLSLPWGHCVESVSVQVTLLYAVTSALARRCTHWSGGSESQAFGRAFVRSRHTRLHPDHVYTSTNLFTPPRLERSPLCRHGRLLSTPAEFRAINPHAMQDDGKLACNRDHRTTMAPCLCQAHAPSLQRRPLRFSSE